MSSTTLQKRTFSENFIRFFDRWTPNSMVIAYTLTIIVGILALILTETPLINFKPNVSAAEIARGGLAGSLVEAWGLGFWTLLELAMQMALILITGSLIAGSPPVRAFLFKVARLPNNMGQAVLLVMAIVPIINWFHFGLGIMIGIHLGRHVIYAAKTKGYKLHAPLFVSLLYACGITGIGISQIAPIFGAGNNMLGGIIFRNNPEVAAMMPERVPFSESVFLPQNIIMCFIALIVVFGVIWLMRPRKESNYVEPSEALITEIDGQVKMAMAAMAEKKAKASSFAEWIDNSIVPSIVIGIFGIIWAVRFFATGGQLNFNNFNMLMIIIGLLLCGSTNQFAKGVQQAIGQTWGIIIQFPFYAGIFGLITYTGLNAVIVEFFMSFATQQNWPFLSYVYTSVVNIAVPNGAAKFFVVAPYALEVAARLDVDIGTMLVSYVAGDVSTNGLLPFWALPYLAMFKLDFKKILPYTAVGSSAVYIVFSIFFLFIF
jgi:short-chain fatty acids transporter